jgi:hypothetical protein
VECNLCDRHDFKKHAGRTASALPRRRK